MADADHMSQTQLARECGVKQPSVAGWLSGKSKFLRGENLLRAARALRVADEWLATGKGPQQRDAPPTTAPLPHLTADESALLDLYRNMSPSRRAAWEAAGRALAQPEIARRKKATR